MTIWNQKAWVVAVALAFVGVGTAQTAHAQDASYMVVTNDGSTYQGQLVENVVGQHVTIKLVSGEIRTFQISDVKTQGPVGAPNLIQQEQTVLQTLTQQSAPAPGSPGGPPVTYNGTDAVQLHITKASGGEGTLLMESPSGWVPVCTMPCTTTIDPKTNYRLHNTDPFRFPPGAPLDVSVGSSGRSLFRALGGTMIGVSAAGVIVGALVAAGVFSSTPTALTPAETKANQQTQSNDVVAGLVVLGASAAVLTAGIILCALHPAATVTTSNGQRLAKRTPLGALIALTTRGLDF